MTPTPRPPTSNNAQYVWAVCVLTLIGAVIVLGVLFLRPASDPLDVIGNVVKSLAPTIAGVLALMKSQETHLSVNSRLDAFMAAHAKAARTEGVIEGMETERAKILRPPAVVQQGGPLLPQAVIMTPVPDEDLEENELGRKLGGASK